MSIDRSLLGRRYDGAAVLVTGGGGFMGAHLARRLAALGADVTVLGRSLAAADAPASARAVRGDVRDAGMVSTLLAARPAIVFHLAGYSGQVPSFADHSESLTTNCLGLINVLDAIRTGSPGTRIVFASSRLVYGRTRSLPVDEDHPREALSLYGIHKRTGEEYCEYYRARWGVESVVLRLANPYGPHDPAGHNRYNVANWMLDEIAGGGEVALYGPGEQLRDYIYIDDAVDAMLLAGIDGRSAGRTYNVGSGEGVRMIDFIRAAIDVAGTGTCRAIDWPDDALAVETGDFIAGIARITGDLAWRPRTSLRDGITATIAASRAAVRDRVTSAPAFAEAGRAPGRRRSAAGSQVSPAVPAGGQHPTRERNAA